MPIAARIEATSILDVGGPSRTKRLEIEIQGAAFREIVLHDWQELQQQVPECPIVCSYEWARTWLEHYGDLVPHEFAVASTGTVVRGIALLPHGVGQTDGPISVKTLHLGTAGEPDNESVCVQYNGICAEETIREEFMTRLIETIYTMPYWDEVRFDGFPDNYVRTLISTIPNAKIFRRQCYCHDLKTAREMGETPLRQLGKSTSNSLRYNLNSFPDLRVEWSENPEEAHAVYEEMVTLHQARWESVGKRGVYASNRFLEFHRALIDRLVPLGKLALIRVTSEGKTVGCNQVFLDGHRVLNYQCGRMAYQGKLSPGLVVDYLSIDESMKRGYDTWDFMAGESFHKRRLSTDHESLTWICLRRPRIKYVVVDTLRRLRHLLRERDLRR